MARFDKISWRLATALMVVCVAVVSATSLGLLRSLRTRATRRLAATSFLESGRGLAASLAQSCFPAGATPDDIELWRRLDWFFDTLSASDPAFESLSVERNGLTLFRRQASLARAFDQPVPDSARAGREAVTAESAVHEVGGARVPVILFTRRLEDGAGGDWTLQLGLRRERLAQEGRLAEEAVRSMYRVALGTQGLALTALLVLVLAVSGRERRRAERRRAEEHLAFAGVLANGIVHDFRNPISSVRLDAQMLEREALRPDGRPARMAELAGRMRATLDRVESVFREFFLLSQPPRSQAESLELGACLRECAELLQARLEAAEVRVEFALPPAPLAIRAHAAPLRRALLNVLSNALAFSPRGAAIEVRARPVPGGAELEVLDCGPGIPAGERERVFEMFVSSRPGGTGLGLFLARTALEISGGTIEALARDGGGCRIRIRLPAGAGTDTAGKAPESP